MRSTLYLHFIHTYIHSCTYILKYIQTYSYTYIYIRKNILHKYIYIRIKILHKYMFIHKVYVKHTCVAKAVSQVLQVLRRAAPRKIAERRKQSRPTHRHPNLTADRVCMYVYMYICMYVCMYVFVFMKEYL